MTYKTLTLTALALSAFLAACGGSDGPGPKTETTQVRVIGDDQGDSGAFGYKFTIQNSDDLAGGFPIFTELVAASLNAPRLCSHYSGVNTSVQFNTNPGCTSYAIAGSRINFQPTVANNLRALPLIGDVINNVAPPSSPLEQVLSFLPGLGSILGNLPSLPLVGGVVQGVVNQLPGVTAGSTPLSIPNQFAAMAASGIGEKDVVIVVAGTNDAADLATVFIQSSIDQGIAFSNLVGTMGITNADRRIAGNEYMAKLADNLYNSISGTLLTNGAKKVVVLNLPNIIQTPRLTQARATIAEAESKVPVIREWVDTFNRPLGRQHRQRKARGASGLPQALERRGDRLQGPGPDQHCRPDLPLHRHGHAGHAAHLRRPCLHLRVVVGQPTRWHHRPQLVEVLRLCRQRPHHPLPAQPARPWREP